MNGVVAGIIVFMDNARGTRPANGGCAGMDVTLDRAATHRFGDGKRAFDVGLVDA